MRYTFAECILDTRLYTLHREGTTVRLRPKVFQVLQYLLEHRDHVVSKDKLCTHVWPGQFISDATLEGCITLTRRASGDISICGSGAGSDRTLWLWGNVSTGARSPGAAVSGTGRSGADRVFRPVGSYLAGTDALAPQPY